MCKGSVDLVRHLDNLENPIRQVDALIFSKSLDPVPSVLCSIYNVTVHFQISAKAMGNAYRFRKRINGSSGVILLKDI